MKILVVSDTHGYIDDALLKHAQTADEIWHAGDIGSIDVLYKLQKITKVRAVYGNIDAADVRQETSKNLFFEVQNIPVCITHIGGYPGKYNADFKHYIQTHNPRIIVCGHSHILKVMYDEIHSALFINPGAIGIHGFHAARTMITFDIENNTPQNMKVIEYQR